MRVEANCSSISKAKGELILQKYSVPPGNWESIDFLGEGIKIAVFCSVDNEKGSVIIKDPKKKLGVFRFENQDDQKGKEMNADLRIEIVGEQEVSIAPKEIEEPGKEVFIFLSPDNQDQEDNLQDILYEKPSEPPFFAS